MKEIQISLCDYDEKLENICIKIKENENLNDLRKKFAEMEFENLFFYKKDLSLIKKEDEKKMKIIDCLVENGIKFSINLKPIIKIEEKTIEYELNNISLFELRKNLGDEINCEYKFYNKMGIVLDEDKTYVFDVIQKNEILIKKINEDTCKFLKIKKSNPKNNESDDEKNKEINDNIKEKQNNNKLNNNINQKNSNKNSHFHKKENSKNNSQEFDNDIDENICEPIIKFSEKKTILKDKENQNKVLNDKNRTFLKDDVNDKNLDLRKYKKLNIDSVYDYYLYPNNIFSNEEEKNCISLLLIGESGAGKSTFINALINFIMNVKYNDEYRFKIVNKNYNNKKFLSKTKEVNIYYIKNQNDYPPINIIDTVCIISKSNYARFNSLERYIIFIIMFLNYF